MVTLFSNFFSTWGACNRTQYLSRSLISIEFPMIALLLAFPLCNKSWLLAHTQLGNQCDAQVCFRLFFNQSVPRLDWSIPEAEFFTSWGSCWLIPHVYQGPSELNLYLESQSLFLVWYHPQIFWGFILSYHPRCWWKYCMIFAPVSAFLVLSATSWMLNCVLLPLSSAVQPVVIQSNRPFLKSRPF